jgi:hypothetical protein
MVGQTVDQRGGLILGSILADGSIEIAQTVTRLREKVLYVAIIPKQSPV